ncbi:MAG: TonB-dependent receptor domain-containing protein [Bryobacteraceae bacterium]
MRLSAAAISRFRYAICALTLAAYPVLAQDTTGKIVGVVSDSSGAVVAGATVTVTNTGTQVAHHTTTDKQGYYQVLELPIGRYEVAAEAAGFSRMVVSAKNSLEINQTLHIDLALQVGAVKDVVTVEGGASAVETENSTIGATVSGIAIEELPLNGRNTLDLLATQPGVTPKDTDASRQAGSYSIGGGRSDSVTYLLDGGLDNHLINNDIVINPNPDAVGEFRVLQSNYAAEYGRSGGGIVSIVIKSGTNSVHGSAFDYLRNEDLDANTFFNNEQGVARQILKRNQYGVTVGGPVYLPHVVDGRNKLFFFFSYEGQKQNANSQAGKITTFTPLEAQGNFSQAVNGGPDPTVASFLEANPYFQPSPTLASEAIIDPASISPVALNYFKDKLIPTSAGGFVFPQAAALANHSEYLGKIDYNIGTRDTLSATIAAQDTPSTVPFSGASGATTVDGYPVSDDLAAYMGNVGYTHSFSPTTIDVARFTAQRNNTKQNYPIGTQPGPAALGIAITPDLVDGSTNINLEGSGMFAGYNPFGPANIIDNTYTFTDDFSWNRGSHLLKAGFLFSAYRDAMIYGYYLNGEFDFYGPVTTVGSGNDLADFLMGLPDDFQEYPNAPTNIRSHSFAGYVQDAWKLTSRLTLNYGLRYEYNQPKYDTQGRSFSFVPGDQSTVFPGAPLGLVFPGDKGAPRGANWPDRTNFAPRVGVAWDVFGNAKTSVRGGFGVFYDILKAEDNLQFNGQAPFFGSAYLTFSPPTGGFTSDPGILSDPFNAAGEPNPFPSKPVNHDVNFADAGDLPIGGGNPFFVDPNLKTPRIYQYNVSIQQQFANNLTLEAGYVGYVSHGLTGLTDIDPFKPGASARVLDLQPGLSGDYNFMNEFQNIGNADYDALQTNLTKRMSNSRVGNTFFTLAYTWSHELDNESGYRQRNNFVPYYNHNQFWASGDADIRQFLSLSGGWELPFEKLSAHGRWFTKGWTLYPIVTWRSGFPLDVMASPGATSSISSPGPSGAGDIQVVRADLVAPVQYLTPGAYQTVNLNTTGAGAQSGNFWFNPNAFSNAREVALNNEATSVNPATLLNQFTYGTLGRNVLRGPGAFNANLSIAKVFRLREATELEFRVDAFNVFNNVEFSNPDTNIGDQSFGQISATADPRIMQVALHLKF